MDENQKSKIKNQKSKIKNQKSKIKNQCKKLIAIVLTSSIIVTSFSSLVQISAQTEEGASIQVAQVAAVEEISVQTASRPVEPTKEFMISNENNFNEFMTEPEYWGNNYKVTLVCDIDMKGKAFNPIKEFGGVFDGCGHIISNLRVQNKSSKNKNSELAFINTLNEFAEIKNITFDNYRVQGKSGIKKAVGLIVTNHGTISNIDIINSSINNIDKKAKSAGFVLNNEEDGTIESCFLGNINTKDAMVKSGFVGINLGKIIKGNITLSVYSKDLSGGFVSENYGSIEGSNFKGSVESKECAGGFCGINAGEISYCKSEGNIIAKTKSINFATICGGFVGENSGIIKESSANGKIEGQEFTGGFVGINNDKGEISSCKAACDVKSHTYVASIYCGGFAGLGAGKMEDCSFDGTVDGCVDSEKVVGGAVLTILAIAGIYLLATYIKKHNAKIKFDKINKEHNDIIEKGENLMDIDSSYCHAEGRLYHANKIFRKTMVAVPISVIALATTSGLATIFTAGRKCAYVAGFCGVNLGEISGCSVNSRSVKAKTMHNKYNICGGFVGTNSGTIKDSDTTGSEIHNKVYTGGRLGGFAGENSGKIENGNTNVAVVNGKCIGGFCGNNSGEISGSRSEGNAMAHSTTKKTKCGGFVGNNEKGVISDCTSTGSATGQECVGGFCGNNSGEISGSRSEGNATAHSTTKKTKCGGFVGNNEKGVISDCTSTGSATGQECVGGFCGDNKGNISSCQSKGDVNSKTYFPSINCGGFVGQNIEGFIDNCKSEGKVNVCIKDKEAVGIILGTLLPGVVCTATLFFAGIVAVAIVAVPTLKVTLSNGANVGGFCGINSGDINGSRSKGSAIANATTVKTKCGGFVGNNEKGKIDGCTSIGSATGQEYVGGFAGVNKSNIINCNAHGKATAKTKANTALAGGFVGENEKGTIISCTSTGGSDSRSSSGQAKAGGFVGINKTSIMNSKASGYVYLSAGTCHKDDGCGGFVGKNDKGSSIDGCYAECIVETTNKKKGGGFVGEAKNKSTIMNSKCKSKIVTKLGIKNNKKFCQDKDKKAIIKNCHVD